MYWGSFIEVNRDCFSSCITDVKPVGVRVVDSGKVGYFPPEWTVTEFADDVTLNAFFGAVKNVDTEVTWVVLEVSFSTVPEAAGEDITLSGPHTVGSRSLGTLSFEIIENVRYMMERDV